MAERRMFAKSVVLADAFLDLPGSTKILYFMMGMTADDDGFINNPKSLMRQVGAKPKDLEPLEKQGYVYILGEGVIVLRHWKTHNHIRQDRYRPTVFQQEKQLLTLGKGGVYELGGIPDDNQVVDQLAPEVTPQDREEEDREEQVSLGQDTPPSPLPGDACAPIIEAYNRICLRLPRCKGLTKKREKMILRWLDKGKTLEDFEELFERAQKSAFLQGLGENGFIAGIDWLLKEGNMVKVLEGNYDDRAKGNIMQPSMVYGEAELEAVRKLMQMED